MILYFALEKLFFILIAVGEGRAASSTRSGPMRELGSRLLEIELPVRTASTEDLIAWARNAMRSMASRIDVTLGRVEEAPTGVPPRKGPPAAGALLSTYASLFGAGNTLASAPSPKDPPTDASAPRDGKNGRPENIYIPLFLDGLEIAKYREALLREYHERESNGARKSAGKYSRAVALRASKAPAKEPKATRATKATPPLVSVPFEAVVTITREKLPESLGAAAFQETRDPPDEFPPYFAREDDDDAGGSGKKRGKLDGTKNTGENSRKGAIAVLADLLRSLGLGKRTKSAGASRINGVARPSEIFTPPPRFQLEDEAQRQRRNESSQRQEFDDDDDDEDEESMGSLGSITDLLPLVIPILEDIIDPETETDLGEVLAAALPLLQGLSDPDDEDAPDIIGMIGPILTNILGGKDGQGSDVAAILGPLLTLIAPLIGPVLGPLVGPLLTASSNPPQGNGSSLATLITAVVGPLVQPTEPGGMSPLSVLVAGVIAALSKELKPGLPGGLDVGALVGAILSGVIAGTSAGLSGTLSAGDTPQSYAPYGPGPVQAGSVSTGTSTGFHAPGSRVHHRAIHAPGNVATQQRVVHSTSQGAYATLAQKYPAGLQSRPPPPPPPPVNYAQHFHATGPLQAGTNDGGSSYLPYGTNAVPANSANPIGLIGSAIKDVLSAGIQVVSSVINAVFGIIGGSSASEEPPRPVYGPPAQGYGSNHP